MQMLELNGLQELNQEELINTDGGDAIQMAWDATPANGSGSYTNYGGGTWAGGAFSSTENHAWAVVFNTQNGWETQVQMY